METKSSFISAAMSPALVEHRERRPGVRRRGDRRARGGGQLAELGADPGLDGRRAARRRPAAAGGRCPRAGASSAASRWTASTWAWPADGGGLDGGVDGLLAAGGELRCVHAVSRRVVLRAGLVRLSPGDRRLIAARGKAGVRAAAAPHGDGLARGVVARTAGRFLRGRLGWAERLPQRVVGGGQVVLELGDPALQGVDLVLEVEDPAYALEADAGRGQLGDLAEQLDVAPASSAGRRRRCGRGGPARAGRRCAASAGAAR